MVDIADMLPSVDLARALVELDHAALDVDGQLAAVAGWERIISWATACQAEVLVDIDRQFEAEQYGWHAVDAARATADQVGLALGVSGGSAQRRVNTAARLIEKVPAVHAALRVGAVTVHHARVAANGAGVLEESVAQSVAASAMTDDAWRTPNEFAETFAWWVVRLDPDGAADRNRAARRGRRVSLRNEPDGMCSLWALLPAEDGAAVHQLVDAHARSSLATNVAGDERTLEERRADALVELVCRRLAGDPVDPGETVVDSNEAEAREPDFSEAVGEADAAETAGTMEGRRPGCACGLATGPAAHGSEPTVHGRRPTICVTVSWSTLIGLDDLPADLTGYGPIDAATARRIAVDPTATWRRLLVDPASGRLLDYGRTRYRPPQDLVDFVVSRDRCCRFPGCDRIAVACDLDHRHDWECGGTTGKDALDALCRRHHLLKHQGGWTHLRDPESGDSFWIDPGGLIHYRAATILPTPDPVEPPRTPAAPPATAAAMTAAPVDQDLPPF